MNDKTRNEISKIVAALEHIRDEEQDKLDNLPESLADSDQAAQMSDAVSYLENAIGELENI